MPDPLERFLPATRSWFSQTFRTPTPPQAQGWPPIQRGEHTLILAPTGSGKTLAAFLWGIDAIFRELSQEGAKKTGNPDEPPLRLVYISPLKALNNDIERNLRAPLAGIRRHARTLGSPLPPLTVMVRTGDTPRSARAAMARRPPHILITTPESLYLLLTSPVAREIFRGVHTVIVDEIHTLLGDKRGAHLALSLERLERLSARSIQRIGLSATVNPREEAAAFLGGQTWQGDEKSRPVPRPVTIVDASHRRPLDLLVQTVVDDFQHLPGDSIWPAVIPHVAKLIRQHRTTLIFCNNRRQAERTADRLNEQLAAEDEGRVEPGQSAMLTPSRPKQTTPIRGPIPAHHGSMSHEVRRQLEEQLKRGELPALVGTSSLELGIDIGSIDLVVHIGSPKSVAQGLQRIGRSGHMVGEVPKGRIIPLHREDLMEATAIARGMLRGDVEPTKVPRQPLDVLAQQIVAMASVESWSAKEMLALVRQAYPYRDLSEGVFRSVLSMLAGRYAEGTHRELRPRLVWDRVNDTVSALPGSRLLALRNGGTITDRGTFTAYLADGKTRLGELDEEFVFETRPGDVFLLGSQTWRVKEIIDDRVIVTDAPGEIPRMPFWRGDFPWRPYALGRRVGAFRRELAERIQDALAGAEARGTSDTWTPQLQSVADWLRQECALDEPSAREAIAYVRRQIQVMGAIATDRTIIVEAFEDAVGTPRVVIHSPFGGRVNGPWALALTSALRERLGVEPETLVNDDGILLRFADASESPPLDVITSLTPEEARERILRELPDSAVFGARFRQNAARALLLPSYGRRRTPFWLQRLKARDLLALVRQMDDFPILVETYRDCLTDVMDLPALEEVLRQIADGQIQIVTAETAVPSPVAASLLYQFISIYMYEWDAPKAERHLQRLAVSQDLLAEVLGDPEVAGLLRPEAIETVSARAARTDPDFHARSADELAVLLGEMGDLSREEIAARARPGWERWLEDLAAQGRALEIAIPGLAGAHARWILSEAYARYRDAFGLSETPPIPIPDHLLRERWTPEDARQRILMDFLQHRGPVTREEILARYAFPADWLERWLDEAMRRKALVSISPGRFVTAERFAEIHRRTLSILRREIRPVPTATFMEFVAQWQHLRPSARLSGAAGLMRVLQQLRAVPVVGSTWERDVLPLRLADYSPGDLDALTQRGELIWIGAGGSDPRRARVRFLFRGEGHAFLPESEPALDELSERERAVLEYLEQEGACFAADIQEALGLTHIEVEETLVNLALAGLATNDSAHVLRAILARAEPAAPRQPLSALEAELSAWRRHQPHRRASRTALYHARRRVARRIGAPRDSVSAILEGRWASTRRAGVMGRPLSEEEIADRRARQLLTRWGIVTAELARAEGTGWRWDAIYRRLQLMEMRGEVRRGYFVEGWSGAQFALPEAVEALRALRLNSGERRPPEPVVMSACDPANLFAAEPDRGPEQVEDDALRTVARLPSNHLVLWRGHVAVISQGEGRSLRVDPSLTTEAIRACLTALLSHLSSRGQRASLGRPVHIVQWNGTPVLESEGLAILEALGCYRDPPGVTWAPELAGR